MINHYQPNHQPALHRFFPLKSTGDIFLAPRTSLGTVAAAENPDRSQRSTPPRCQSVTPQQEKPHTHLVI